MKEVLLIAITAIFIQNIVLAKFLGVCPFLGVSRKLSTALGMGGAVVFVTTVVSAVTWAVYYLLLKPLDLIYLQTIAFILVIASLVQFVEIVLKKFMPPLYKALGIYLPLITTNCAVLGVALINIEKELSFGLAVVNGFMTGVGFTLVLAIFSGIREKIETSDVPAAFQGISIALVAAALISVAFLGFTQLAL